METKTRMARGSSVGAVVALACTILFVAAMPAATVADAQCVSPNKGPTNGGTLVTLSGEYSRVLFDGIDATSVESYSTSGSYGSVYYYTTCLTPPHAAGTVDVVADGHTCHNGFTYAGVCPAASFTVAPATGLAPLTVQFTDTSAAGSTPITAWNWSFGDNSVAYTQNPAHTYALPGIYSAKLQVTDANNYEDLSDSTQVVVTGTTTIVPNVIGMTQANAEAALSVANLKTGTVTQQYNATVPAGNVISQSPTNGTLVLTGTTVALAVSLGAAPPITSIDDLQRIGNDPAYPLYGSYVLAKDIDASGTATWNSGAGFQPIGNDTSRFVGAFDGQGHVISGLTISRSGEDNVGLFGVLGPTGQIQNAGLEGCVVLGGDVTGGLVGLNEGGALKQSFAKGTVTGSWYVGGLIGNNYGTVTHCHSAAMVSGSEITGGLVGANEGQITQCYATGTVLGDEAGGLVGSNYGSLAQCYATALVWGFYNAGGLVGYNVNDYYYYYGRVSQSFAAGAVWGLSAVGGLIGANVSNVLDGPWIDECYASVSVSGRTSVGGLIGWNNHETVTDSYWDIETSGQSTSAGGTGITISQLLQHTTFTYWNWGIWSQLDGQTVPYLAALTPAETTYTLAAHTDGHGDVIPSNGVYPAWSFVALTPSPNAGYKFAGWLGGNSLPNNPAPINPLHLMMSGDMDLQATFLPDAPIALGDLAGLTRIGRDPSYPLFWDYVLTKDIDASATATWNDGAGFEPIGSKVLPFTGTFDGQDHVVSGLTINRPGDDLVGMFRMVAPGGQVKNFGLTDVTVTGDNEVGGLVALNYGAVTSCYVTGSVFATIELGSLVGYNLGSVLQSYAVCAVSGLGAVGGLVAQNDGSATQCYAAGSVSGSWQVGGLVGYNTSMISQCYATGPVVASDYVGGLVGFHGGGEITQCYAMGTVTGTTRVGGLIGSMYHGGSTVNDSYWDTNASGQSTSDGGTGEPTPALMSQVTFVNWDFQGVWSVIEGTTYPFLQALPCGNLTVTILPPTAAAAETQWSIDGGVTWNSGGATVVSIPAGPAMVTFKPGLGCTAPDTIMVTIVQGQTTAVSATATIVPVVASVVRADANPSAAARVSFTVTFNEPVTGVDPSDFFLTASGVASARVTSVSADTGATRTVAVDTGTGEGTIRLDLVDDDSITDARGAPLGGVRVGNGNFNSGEVYTIQGCLGIATDLTDARAYLDDAVTSWVHPSCRGAAAYQWVWSDGGQDVLSVGENTDTLTISPVTMADAGYYWCYVSSDGTVYPTRAGALSVADHLKILDPPRGGNIPIGSSHTFEVLTSGGFVPLAYLWKHDGKPVGTDSTYTVNILTLQDSDLGSYTVQVSDANTDVVESTPVAITTDVGLPSGNVWGMILLSVASCLGAVVAIGWRRRGSSG